MRKWRHTSNISNPFIYIGLLLVSSITLTSCANNLSATSVPPAADLSTIPAKTATRPIPSTASLILPNELDQWKFNRVDNVVWSPDSESLLVIWGLSSDISSPDRWKSNASLFRIDDRKKLWDADNFDENAIFQADGKSIITAGASLQAWDATTGKITNTLFEGGSATLYPAFIAQNSQLLLGTSVYLGGEDFRSEIGIYDPAHQNLAVFAKQIGDLTRLSVAPDGTQFMTAFSNVKESISSNMVFLWDIKTWEKRCSFPGADAVFKPKQNTIMVVTRDGGKISTYDRSTCANLSVLDEENYVGLFSLSPDGQFFAVAGTQSQRVQVQSAKDGKLRYEIDVAPSILQNIVFNPDGHFLSTVSFIDDKNGQREYTVEVWMVATGGP